MSTPLDRIRQSLKLRNDRNWADQLDWPAFEDLREQDSEILRVDLESAVQEGDYRAVLGLQRIGAFSSFYFLTTHARKPETKPDVRLACLKALDGLRESDFLVSLVIEHDLFNKGSWAVRVRALKWLQDQSSTKVISILKQCLRNEYGPIRSRASELLFQHMGLSGEEGSRLSTLSMRLSLNLKGAWSQAADDFDVLFQEWENKASLDGWMCGPSEENEERDALVASFQDNSYSHRLFQAMAPVDRDSFSFIFHQHLETHISLSPMRLAGLGVPGAQQAMQEVLPGVSGDFLIELLQILWGTYRDPNAEQVLQDMTSDPAYGWKAKEILNQKS